MRFLFCDDAGAEQVVLKGEAYKYIVKVRRSSVGDALALRRREASGILYTYRIESADGRQALLTLLNQEDLTVAAPKPLHLGWCHIDPKSVEKVLPQLNEAGVAKITFIGCERSQRQFKPDFERMKRILEASMQQCGRSKWMLLETAPSLAHFIDANPQTVVLDFCDDVLQASEGIETVLIGCEGGFSEAERRLLSACRTVRLDTPMILRSESAAVAAAAKILF